jgi:L-threonylcarbamoyladenylate synthase
MVYKEVREYDSHLPVCVLIAQMEDTMETILKELDSNEIDQEMINQAGEIIKSGGLVAFPTETVYGLGANALDEEASAKIYEAKGRPSDNPLIVHIAKIEDLEKIVTDIPPKAKLLADKFWPGPLTMIFQKSNKVPLGTTGGLNTVAVRMPNHKLALGLIEASGGYVAAPSANTSGRPSPTKASHVFEDMRGKIDMILDGGMVGIGIESTIVDVSTEIPMILRPGYINQEMLEEVVGEVLVDPTILNQQDTKDKPKAPGMKYKHYAPKAELTIVEGEENSVISYINKLTAEKIDGNFNVGIIATDETKDKYKGGQIKSIGQRSDELSISHNLYNILREFDDTDVEFIYSESFQNGKMGVAIMNRLLKAAGHKKIQV